MVTLREANEKFCQGAEEIIYIYNISGRLIFSKKVPRLFDPLKHGILRSIKYAAPGEYLMVMDIDGIGLTQDLMDAASVVYDGSESDEKPLIKDSGQKGLQLIWKVIFPKPVEDGKAVKLLEMLAWEKYNKFNLDRFSISFGPPGVDKPHIDTSMFQRRRKIRGFCTRFNGKFSVPLNAHDDLWTAELRRGLVDELPDFEIGTIIFTDDLITIDQPRRFYGSTDDVMTGIVIDPTVIPVSYRDTFMRLPSYLRTLVMYDGDPHHHRKRLLVWYLFRMGYSPDAVIDFVWNTCKWCDLNSLDVTRAHVLSLFKTYERVVNESGSFSFPEFLLEWEEDR